MKRYHLHRLLWEMNRLVQCLIRMMAAKLGLELKSLEFYDFQNFTACHLLEVQLA